MLSRVADSLYWMSRNLERAEHAARLVRVNLNLVLDLSSISVEQSWTRSIAGLGLPLPDGPRDPQSFARYLLFSPDSRYSIVTAISIARENARQVRELLSSEMWEQINRLYHDVRRPALEQDEGANPIALLNSIDSHIHMFQGVTDSTMTHGEAWQFIQTGRYLERAVAVAALLRFFFEEFRTTADGAIEPADYPHWVALLKSCTAFEAYCKFYTADLRASRIAEFLLLNGEFPHSVRFAVNRLDKSVEALPSAPWIHKNSGLARYAGRLKAALEFSQIEELTAAGMHAFLAGVTRQCFQIHTALYQTHIDYAIASAVEA